MRYYNAQDMARLYCDACNGCGDCCRGMGDTVHLDPYDICILTNCLHTSFQQLLDEKLIGLRAENGLALPHLQMTDAPDIPACPFLAGGRCSIHDFRPGFCRLFPLGRAYANGGVRYFVVENGCDMPGKVKVRIDRWLGIPHIAQYEAFTAQWHEFLKCFAAAVREAGESDPDYARQLPVFLLQVFYLTTYAPDTFYESFAVRMKRAQEVL